MIEIKQLTKTYGNQVIFQKLDLAIPENEITCILGPSGCGKTTLLNLIAGLQPYDEGSILGVTHKKISYIFQDTRLLAWRTAIENIEFVLLSLYSKEKAREIAKYYLDLVGLSAFENYYPDQLSGGMKQRISIARAFAFPSEILLMDEPFIGLDYELKDNLIDEFLNIWKQNKKTVIFVTHERDDAEKIGHRMIYLT